METLKFRHLSAESKKTGLFECISATQAYSDGTFIKANQNMIAFMSKAQGDISFLDYAKSGRQPLELAKISASAVDFDFLPYEPNLLVSGGEDCKLKVWKLPQKLTVEDTPKAPIFSLLAHEKRINILSVSKSVKGLVSTASFDQNLRVWDLERGTNVASFSWPNKDSTTSLEWRDDSSLLGTIKKDKQVRIFDFRTSNPEVFYHNGHQSVKPQKFQWMGNSSYYLTFGSNQKQEREFTQWDTRQPGVAVATLQIDQMQDVLIPFYDRYLNILYVTGKGDSSIKYYEYKNGIFNVNANSHKSNVSGKSYAFLSKLCCNSQKNEIQKVLKLGETFVETISIICPRIKQDFQEDLFPDCIMDYGVNIDRWQKKEQWVPKTARMDNTITLKSDGNWINTSNSDQLPTLAPQQIIKEVVTQKEHVPQVTQVPLVQQEPVVVKEQHFAEINPLEKVESKTAKLGENQEQELLETIEILRAEIERLTQTVQVLQDENESLKKHKANEEDRKLLELVKGEVEKMKQHAAALE